MKTIDNKKIAIIFYGDYHNTRGAFNATINRIKHLIALDKERYDVYLMISYPDFFIRKVKKISKYVKDKEIIVEGVKINMLWTPFTLFDYIVHSKLHLESIIENRVRKRFVKKFKDYKLLSVHSTEPGFLAFEVYKQYNVPYVVTWHGGDIHTSPYFSKIEFEKAKSILENARGNFFVSEKLLELSKDISQIHSGIVLYNGVDKNVFYEYSLQDKSKASQKYNINLNELNVAYVGNFYSVKNVLSLPPIFKIIQEKLTKPIAFYLVGSGKFEQQLREDCLKLGVNVYFILNVPSKSMPDIYNCMDLVVLPSLNEGLPLTAVESLACGTQIVGSRVGGIAEAIGVENTITTR